MRWAIHEPRVLAATIELVGSPSAAAGAPTPGRSRSSSAHSTIDVPVNLDVDRVIRPGPAAGVPLEQTTTDHLLVVVTRAAMRWVARCSAPSATSASSTRPDP